MKRSNRGIIGMVYDHKNLFELKKLLWKKYFTQRIIAQLPAKRPTSSIFDNRMTFRLTTLFTKL